MTYRKEVTLKMTYRKEIFKLKKMLEDAKIPFVTDDRSDFYYLFQIGYPDLPKSGNCVCSVIQGSFTCGNEDNKLEIMGLLTDEEAKDDSVIGYLSAEEVFKRIESHYRDRGEENVKESFGI